MVSGSRTVIWNCLLVVAPHASVNVTVNVVVPVAVGIAVICPVVVPRLRPGGNELAGALQV